jgi:hypothetical protein
MVVYLYYSFCFFQVILSLAECMVQVVIVKVSRGILDYLITWFSLFVSSTSSAWAMREIGFSTL